LKKPGGQLWVDCVSSAQGTAVVDRVETMQARYRRRQSQQHLTLLSLGPALAAESNVGLTARTVSSQGSRDRPQPLHCSRASSPGESQQKVDSTQRRPLLFSGKAGVPSSRPRGTLAIRSTAPA